MPVNRDNYVCTQSRMKIMILQSSMNYLQLKHRAVAFLLCFFLSVTGLVAQPVSDPEGDLGVGTILPDPSAVVDLTSTGKGFLMPRMMTAERDVIPSPAEGLMIYNTGCWNGRDVEQCYWHLAVGWCGDNWNEHRFG